MSFLRSIGRAGALALLWVLATSASAAPPLRVAMSGSYPPLHERTDDGFVGFEPELAALIAAHLGRPLELVDARQLGVSTLDAVAKGQADLAMNAITVTAERRKRVDFTRPYLELRYRLAGTDAAVDPARINASVAVTSDLAAAALTAEAPSAKIVRKPSMAAALEAFALGEVDWIAGEDVALVEATAQIALSISQRGFGSSPVAIATARGASAPIDEALAALAPEIERLKVRWQPGLPGSRPNGLHGMSVGAKNVCAVRVDGQAMCWGQYGVTYPQGRFEKVDPDSECGLNSDGGVQCWGKKKLSFRGTYQDLWTVRGNMFAHRKDGRFDSPNRFGSIQTLADASLHFCIGREFSCTLSLDGITTCDGKGEATKNVPTRPLRRLACGDEHACGLTESGEVICWGGDDAIRSPPPGPFEEIVASDGFSCALDADRSARCWPAADEGAALLNGTRVRELVASEGHVCGIHPNGEPFCTGAAWNDWFAHNAASLVPSVGASILDALPDDWERIDPSGPVRHRWCDSGMGISLHPSGALAEYEPQASLLAQILGVARSGDEVFVRTTRGMFTLRGPVNEGGYRVWHWSGASSGSPRDSYVPRNSKEVPIEDVCEPD